MVAIFPILLFCIPSQFSVFWSGPSLLALPWLSSLGRFDLYISTNENIKEQYSNFVYIDKSQVNCLKFSGDGRLLAVTGYEVIKVYDVHSNRPLTNMSNNSDSNSKNITCVNFATTDNTSLITGNLSLHNFY